MTKEEKEARKREERLIDEMLEVSGTSREAILGGNGLVAKFRRRLVEKVLAGELTHHLGYVKGEEPPGENCRNGTSEKTILTEDGPLKIGVPRDRAGSY